MNDPQRTPVESDEIDLIELVRHLYARKMLIILVTSAVTIFGVVYSLLVTPVFQADALVQLEEKSGGGLGLSEELSAAFGEAPQSVTEIEILNSRMVLGRVVENLALDMHTQPLRLPIVGNFLTRYSIPKPNLAWLTPFSWGQGSISVSRLSVSDAPEDEEIYLTYLGTDTYQVHVGQELAIEGVVGRTDSNIKFGITLHVERIEGHIGQQFSLGKGNLSNEIAGLRGNLSISEKGKNSSILRLTLKGENKTKITKTLDEILTVYLSQNLARTAAEAESSLQFIRQQLPETLAKVKLAEAALNAFKLSQTSVDLTFETRSVLEQSVELQGQLSALVLKEQELQKLYTPQHPAYQALLENRAELQRRLQSIEGQTAGLPATQQVMLSLSQDLAVSQQVYLQLLSREQELNVIKAGKIGNIRVIDRALAQSFAVAPRKRLIVALSLILGLILAVGIILVRSFTARGVDSTDEIERQGVPVYSTIPKVGNGEFSGKGKRNKTQQILAKVDPSNMAVEALRSLRTSLHFGMLDAKSKMLMITSARPEDGKSFVGVNLATVVAQAGQNVCLVDADIRRGYLNRFFGIERDAPGLTDVLSGSAQIEDVIRQDSESGLFVISAGRYPPNPSELLMHENFAEVAKYLDRRFDLTIFDTPPVLAVTDPMIIGKYVGMILMIVRHRQTNVSEINAAVKAMETNGLAITGAVLNVYDAKKARYGGYGSYSNSYYQYEYKAREQTH